MTRYTFALLTTLLFLAHGRISNAQSQSRSFQMGLYIEYTDPTLSRVDADLPMFGEGEPQPPGRSIMLFKSYSAASPILASENYDWSRIVAALVDEPYGPQADRRIDSIIKYPDGSPACQGDPTSYIAPIDASLAQAAAALKTVAPMARFWVNFTMAEANWIGACGTPQEFNRPYIDVVSADWYYADFSVLQPFYSVVAANPAKPGQQLALVPGTFFRSGQDDPNVQASYLQSYFNFANSANTSCNLSLGSRGVTGSFDGCLVWMVLGWPADTVTDGGSTYIGELDPRATQISVVWHAQIALPVRHGLSYELTRPQIVSTLIQQWLND